MATITDIKDQKKPGRVSVFVDKKYSFSCPELELAKLGLAIGQTLSTTQLARIKNQTEVAKATEKALDYLDLRPRSIFEMKAYLQRKGYDATSVDQAIAYLIDKQLLNDRNFAITWIENRKLLNPRSKKQLRLELFQKGLDRQLVAEVLVDYQDVDEETALKEIIEKRGRLYQDQAKLISYLMRKGFNYRLIKTYLTEFNQRTIK